LNREGAKMRSGDERQREPKSVNPLPPAPGIVMVCFFLPSHLRAFAVQFFGILRWASAVGFQRRSIEWIGM
jgi:hypothetical protein